MRQQFIPTGLARLWHGCQRAFLNHWKHRIQKLLCSLRQLPGLNRRAAKDYTLAFNLKTWQSKVGTPEGASPVALETLHTEQHRTEVAHVLGKKKLAQEALARQHQGKP